jgi:hypothetical protein
MAAGTMTAPESLETRPELKIVPASAEILTGDACPFTIEPTDLAIEWSLSPEAGSIDAHGIYSAPAKLNGSRAVVVLAREQGGARFATATITLNDAPQRIAWLGWFGLIAAALLCGGVLMFWRLLSGSAALLGLVMVMGALGSMLHFASSFAQYVGNRTFQPSWFWYYVSRPFVGAGLAVIFFFLFGVGPQNAGGLMKVATVSALVGLFSDRAVRKLSDILDTVLAAKDDRKDKVDAR